MRGVRDGGTATFFVQTNQGSIPPSAPSLESLPTGLTLSTSGVMHVEEAAVTVPEASVIIKEQYTSRGGVTRKHWKRLSFSDATQFEVTTSSNNLTLPKKLFFPEDANILVPTEGLASSYGMDQSTNPMGKGSYISISGGAAPYRVTIVGVTCTTGLDPSSGTLMPLVSILQNGTQHVGQNSTGLQQFFIGLTDDPQGTPTPLNSGSLDAASGSGWSYIIQSSKAYFTSLSNGGFIKPNEPGTTHFPFTINMEILVEDSNHIFAQGPGGASGPIILSIPVIEAPSVPQVVNPQTVISTGGLYNMEMGYTAHSTSLGGYPFSEPNANELFFTDIGWWLPVISPIWSVWSSTLPYVVGDTVIRSGDYYIATEISNNTDPSDSSQTAWALHRDPAYSLTLLTKLALSNGGPFAPILFERYPTHRDSLDSNYYDYIEVQRKLNQFTVAGELGLSSPANKSQVFVTNSPINIQFSVTGGTGNYTWTSNVDDFNLTGIQGTSSSSNKHGSNYTISGSRIPGPSDVFPHTSPVTITVQDTSAPYNLTATTEILLTFTSPGNFSVITDPYMGSDLRFYISPNTQNHLLTDRSLFPWNNTTEFDYTNDYTDGLLPGGAQIGYISGLGSDYTLTIKNGSTDPLWSNFRYKMPMGLCFGVRSDGFGGYLTDKYFQIIDAPPSSAALIQHATIEPLDPIFNPDGSITMSLKEMKAGDIFAGSLRQLGSTTSQCWELGYWAPHFELQSSQNSNAPRDSFAELDTNVGSLDNATGLAISDVVYTNMALTSDGGPISRHNFITRLNQGEYDHGAYNSTHATPVIGSGFDTLNVIVEKAGYAPYPDAIRLPIAEDYTAKLWVASADKWQNPSYYWLGSGPSSKCAYKITLDNNIDSVFYGFTECDRLLKEGAFPSPGSSLYPSIQSSLVNFQLTELNSTQQTYVTHSRDIELHNNPDFITNLQSFFNVRPGDLTDSSRWQAGTFSNSGWHGGTFNRYLDYDLTTHTPGPLMDSTAYKYFKGPRASANQIPTGGSRLTHPSLTYIDRGFRINASLDAYGLWNYLISSSVGSLGGSPGLALETGTRIHLVWMFLVTRPNISLSPQNQDAAAYLDLNLISAASGIEDLASKYLRGKSYTRVPIHMVLEVGPYNSSESTQTPIGPSVTITAG